MSRLLIVEDDDIQQAVLKSALEKRGYEIEVASDGLTAVRMLRGGGFDLALMDYHIPEIDGFASARLLHDLMNDEDRPKLIAVTAAIENLNSRELSTSVFDAIIPKPLDLPGLLTVIESQLHATVANQTARAAEATWRELGLPGAPSVVAFPHPSPAQSQLLRCYFDLSGRHPPQAVLLLGPSAADDAVVERTRSPHFSLPFISLTGADGNADAAFSAADRGTWEAVAGAITRFADQRRVLAHGPLDAADLDTRLLVYLFLSGRALQPELSFESPECARYPGYFPDGEVRLAAERLAGRGLLDRRFFERFHTCGACGSSRLNVREECPACHSAQLREVPLVHHFRCAHQAPEADFVRGAHLVCPKCRKSLRQIGIDYDKTAVASQCGACGLLSGEPVIGFVCLDCGGHTAGAAAAKRDVFKYTLTAEGIALLRRGAATIADCAPRPESALPEAIRRAMESGRPIDALIELRYRAQARLVARRGGAAFSGMRRLFLDNLLNALDGDCEVASGPETDLVLISGARPEALADLGPVLLQACQEVLSEGLQPELRFLERAMPMGSAS